MHRFIHRASEHRSTSPHLIVVAFLFVVASCSGEGSTLQIEDEPLVYLPMGNSLTFDVVDYYSAMLEEDFGVEVEVRDHTVPAQNASNLLFQLQNNVRLRDDLAEADVITLLIPNNEWRLPIQTVTGNLGLDPADCEGDDGEQCLREMIDDYKTQVDAVFEELTTMVDPSEVLIRGQDFYMFPTNGVYTEETFEMVYPYWVEAQDYVEEVAGQYGIPVAQVCDDFMGPDGTENPEESGLIVSDGTHPSLDGAQRIANLIHDLGYSLAG